ncbi:hypothetical protein [Roseibium aggregatum]|uniref:hypothetical protein n=1 Tax=Roseibium aggregatum TaxID=187304 RepID=UPI00094B460C|nr:hypothetical protein [Roseibium aggregatum]UFI05997.1 hypothetical protein ST40_012980 [Roseibium aggregatum]
MGLKPEDFRKKRNLGATALWSLAILLTFVWCAYAAALMVPQVVNCSWKWGIWMPVEGIFPIMHSESCLELNEFGDFLAGTFAPLAFLWLVLAVILQSAELKEQRLALVAQLEEAQQHTSMLAAEQAISRARTTREKLEAYLRMLQSGLRLVGHNQQDAADSISYFTRFGLSKTVALQKAMENVAGERAGKRIATSAVDRGKHDLARAREVMDYVDELKSLQRQLSGYDLQIFEACQLPKLINVIEQIKEFDLEEAKPLA